MSKYDEDYQIMKALYLEYFRKLEKENEELKKENQSLKKENVFSQRCEVCNDNARIICEIDNGVSYYFCSDSSCKNERLNDDVIISKEYRRMN